jgi:hypothetical protein
MNDEFYEDQDESTTDEPFVAPESDEGGSTTDDQPSTINHQPSTSAVAQQAFALLDGLDFKSRRRAPSVLTVFRLYCKENMTVTEIARQCHCSLSTVSDRLKILREKTGLPPKSFRKT